MFDTHNDAEFVYLTLPESHEEYLSGGPAYQLVDEGNVAICEDNLGTPWTDYRSMSDLWTAYETTLWDRHRLTLLPEEGAEHLEGVVMVSVIPENQLAK